jgi:cytidylate kinase
VFLCRAANGFFPQGTPLMPENHMLADLSTMFGIGGGTLLLLGYLSGVFGWRWSPPATSLASALGAVMLCVHLAERAAIPPLVLNSIWAVTGWIAFCKALRKRSRPVTASAQAALEKLQSLGLRPGMDVNTLRALTLRPMGEDLRIISLTHDTVTGDDELVFLNVMPANVDGPVLHLHRSASQLETVISGEVRFELNGNVRTLTAGDSLWVPAGSAHSFAPIGGAAIVASVAYGLTPFRFWLAWHGSPPYFALSIEEQVRVQHDLSVLAETELCLGAPTIVSVGGAGGCGKSTLVRMVGERLRAHRTVRELYTGRVYRTLAVLLHADDIDLADEPSALRWFSDRGVQIASSGEVLLRGELVAVAANLDTESVGRLAAQISSHPTLRSKIVSGLRAAIERNCSEGTSVVLDARDGPALCDGMPWRTAHFYVEVPSAVAVERRVAQTGEASDLVVKALVERASRDVGLGRLDAEEARRRDDVVVLDGLRPPDELAAEIVRVVSVRDGAE